MTGPTPERETNPFVEVFAEDWNSKEDAVYDAPGPTPERRWRWAETFPVRLVTPDGEHLYLTIRDDNDRLRVTATLNEAEDLRERVRVLEAAFWRTEQTEMESDGKCGRCGFRDRHERQCPWRVLETDGRARQVGRAP